MGQGYSLTTLSAGGASIDVPELAELTYEKALSEARFMKSVRARHRDGQVVAKVVMKPYASMKFNKYIKEIMRERKILKDIPNALGYHRAFETTTNGYLVRQYIYNSIYDRMSTRPFLEDIEKRWLAFQLLSAIRDCHAAGLYHGDIKTENTLVTSWNWLLLCDFSASFKPVFLPEDNPADFSFYFDIAGRRTCYLAPERFLFTGEKGAGKGGVTWAMDVFSVGCVLAEIFLETPIFNLSQLLKYRQHEYNPVHNLSRIEDPDIRDLIEHMIQLEPESRYSADEYLNFWRRKAFPEYFYSFLHQYMHLITDPTSGRSAISSGSTNLGESDDRIDRVYFDFDKIAYFLDYTEVTGGKSEELISTPLNNLFPLHVDIPNQEKKVPAKAAPPSDDGTLLFANIVTAALRSTARSTGRIRACELLLAFGERMTDEAKLDRVLPHIMFLLGDKVDIVKVAALRTLTQLLAMVSTASPVNAYLFPEYILPRLESFTAMSGSKPSPLVRATYASCLAPLAQTASRFLDVVQALKAEGTIAPVDPDAEDGMVVHAYQNLYDVARADLVRFFEAQTKAMLTDTDADVRRAFLGSVSSLCVFFGSAKANDVILSHLNTYLNDRDWRLKSAFFETIVGVATYVGGTNLEEFILPLMIQAMTDPQESVVEKVLRSLASMAELGLFQKSKTWELVDLIARFTMHPNIWIREAAAHFVASLRRYISVADEQCIVRPLLAPYLRVPPKSLSETDLLDALKKPLPRAVLDMSVSWITNVEKGTFWRSVQQRISSNLMEDRVPITPAKDLMRNGFSRMQKNEEDQQWISRLRTAGMTADDEFKFIALREYLWRTTKRKPKSGQDPNVARYNDILKVHDLGVAPEKVLFDHGEFLEDAKTRQNLTEKDDRKTQSIADALLDASTSLDPTLASRDSSPASSDRISHRPDPPRKGLAIPTRAMSPRVPSPLSTSPATAHGAAADSLPSKERQHSRLQNELSDDSTPNDTPTSRSPVDPSALLKQDGDPLKKKASAMHLMQRNSTKANAATSMSAANAMGEVDGPHSKEPLPLVRAREQKRRDPSQIRFKGAHTYAGNDPSILKLLDSLYLDSYPVDAAEYGPLVTPIENRVWDKRPSRESSLHWRPTGNLVAVLGEHTGAITRIVVAPDHSFFITGSADGSIRVWDTARLERNLAHRSRNVHKHDSGAQVTSLCFIGNTHCFASSATDGSIHIVRIDCSESEGMIKYNRMQLMHQWRLPRDESHAVWIEHYKTDSQSTIFIATNTSELIALDLRGMTVLYTLDIPPHHGTPTCFVVNSERHWLLLGTSHGVLGLFDLRFRLCVLTWAFPAATPIHRVSLHPNHRSKQYSHQVCIAGGTGGAEITIFDLDELSCKHIYRSASFSNTSASSAPLRSNISRPRAPPGSVQSMKPYTPWYPDATTTSDTMLSRFATSLCANAAAPNAAQTPERPSAPPHEQASPPNAKVNLVPTDSSPRALFAGLRYWPLSNRDVQGETATSESTTKNTNAAAAPKAPRSPSAQDTGPYILAAGGNVPDEDRLVRFWDVVDVRKSCIISGVETATDEPANASPSSPTSGRQQAPTSGAVGFSYSTMRTTGDATRACEVHEERKWTPKSPPASSGASASSGRSKGNTVISLQQRQLLRSHLDTVLDVAVVEYPMRMVVSGDRSGVVFVFS